MKYLRSFNENNSDETEIVFTHENNPNVKFNIFKSRNGKITRIENESNIRFPLFYFQGNK